MSKGITIQVKGFDKLSKTLRGLGEHVQKEAQMEFLEAAHETKSLAVKKAPADESALRSSISVKPVKDTFEVVVGKNYAAFIEFGTKSKFRAPSELGNYPSIFRGRRGGGGDPLKAIQGWVKRKKIAGTYSVKTKRRKGNKLTREKQDRQVAFLIWRKISREGINPHPYLFPAFFEVRGKLIGRLRRIVKDAIK